MLLLLLLLFLRILFVVLPVWAVVAVVVVVVVVVIAATSTRKASTEKLAPSTAPEVIGPPEATVVPSELPVVLVRLWIFLLPVIKRRMRS